MVDELGNDISDFGEVLEDDGVGWDDDLNKGSEGEYNPVLIKQRYKVAVRQAELGQYDEAIKNFISVINSVIGIKGDEKSSKTYVNLGKANLNLAQVYYQRGKKIKEKKT